MSLATFDVQEITSLLCASIHGFLRACSVPSRLHSRLLTHFRYDGLRASSPLTIQYLSFSQVTRTSPRAASRTVRWREMRAKGLCKDNAHAFSQYRDSRPQQWLAYLSDTTQASCEVHVGVLQKMICSIAISAMLSPLSRLDRTCLAQSMRG